MRSFILRLQRVPVLFACLCSSALAVLLTTGPINNALAQSGTGYITVYADELGGACVLLDDAPRTFNVYVLHEEMPGMVGCEFQLAASEGFGAVYVSEAIPSPFVFVGDTQNGIYMGYAGCLSGVRVLATVTYTGLGTSVPCSYLEIAPHPDNVLGVILAQDCLFQLLPTPTRGRLHVNADAACPPWCVVPTEETTWGRVKALYRD